MTDPDDATVNYTVKELLSGIKEEQAKGFARIEVSMSHKADKADVARMETRLDAHAKALDQHRTEISELQMKDHARMASESTTAWWHTRFAKIGGFFLGLALGSAALADVIRWLAGG